MGISRWPDLHHPGPTVSGAEQEESQTNPSPAPSRPLSPTTSPAADSPADQRFQKLLDSIGNGSPRDRRSLESEVIQARKTFPDDFRFPYLEAMLLAYREASHHDAFHKLATAAGIAIRTEASTQMVNMLMDDSRNRRDVFYGLAQGHRAWRNIMDALRTNDEEILQSLFR